MFSVFAGAIDQIRVREKHAADDADEYGGGERNDHPDGCDAARTGQLVLGADAHEAQQNLRHAEVAETPGHGRSDCEAGILACVPKERNAVCRLAGWGGGGEQTQKSGDFLRVFDHRAQTARGNDAEDNHEHERRNHDNGLHEVGRALREEPAEEGVGQHEQRRYNDHGVIARPEELAKELAAGHEAAARIRREEDDDHYGGNGHQHALVLMEPAGEEVRNRDGVRNDAVAAEALGDDQPVEVGADRKADCRPARVGQTAPVRQSRQTHEKPPGHIGRFRAEGGDPGAKRAAAEEVRLGVLVCAFGKHDANDDDDRHVRDNGN